MSKDRYWRRAGEWVLQPKFNTKRYGHRSFQYFGSEIWNSLPASIKGLEDCGCLNSIYSTGAWLTTPTDWRNIWRYRYMSYHLYVKYHIQQFFISICCISPNQYFYAPLLQHICVHSLLIHLDGAAHTRVSHSGVSSVQMVTCHLFGAMPLPGPMLWYHYLDPCHGNKLQ